MASVGIKKRGKVYQYQFEIAPVKGQRKWITKSGFKTKAEAQEEGNKAYTEYLNAGMPFKDCNISYTDYLDYWLDNYCKINFKFPAGYSYLNKASILCGLVVMICQPLLISSKRESVSSAIS